MDDDDLRRGRHRRGRHGRWAVPRRGRDRGDPAGPPPPA
jgi:hypothetical protein